MEGEDCKVNNSASEDMIFLTGNQDSDIDTSTAFYFENDYLPMKSNPDYIKLLRTLTILLSQRIKVVQDIDRLEGMKLSVREDPNSVLQSILSGNSSYCGRCSIEEVPEIDWSKYKCGNMESQVISSSKRTSKQEIVDPYSQVSEHSSRHVTKVRGRSYDENKPQTFNQFWTVEEQLRLEALLEEFPPEPVESRRWKKIADALGNRTTQQVCSRVQKYFTKLKKAGIAIPGRPPRASVSKPRLIHRKNKHLLYRPSTFFPGVAMQEMEDSDDSETIVKSEFGLDLSHWVDILAKLKDEKANQDNKELVLHYGYQCAGCKEMPIHGLRWECKTCPQISLCCDCIAGLVDSSEPVHPPAHLYSPVHLYVNPLYNTEAFSTNNYLDPNFMS